MEYENTLKGGHSACASFALIIFLMDVILREKNICYISSALNRSLKQQYFKETVLNCEDSDITIVFYSALYNILIAQNLVN